MGRENRLPLAERARRQHGVVRGGREERNILRSQGWEGVARGVWRLVGWPETSEQKLMIAVLASSGIASHRAAAWLHRLDGFERFACEVTVGPNQRYGGCVAHRSDVPKVDVTTVRGIPCTTATRTVIDLAGVAELEVVELAFDSAVRAGLTTPLYVHRRLDDLGRKGRAGTQAVDDLIACHLGVTDSELEGRFLQLCRTRGLPRPVLHLPVAGYEVDCAYPELKVAIELDGFGFHADRVAFQRDRTKQNLLTLQGWRILRFTRRDVLLHPDTVAAAILTALAA